MSEQPLSPEVAARIWGVLVDCGATDNCFGHEFVNVQSGRFVTEYRFQGNLGFGGKFWRNNGKWYVGCYREDDTPERLKIIERTNIELERLRSGADSNEQTLKTEEK